MTLRISNIKNPELLKFVQKYNSDKNEELDEKELKDIYSALDEKTNFNFLKGRVMGSITGGIVVGALLGAMLVKGKAPKHKLIFNFFEGSILGGAAGFMGGSIWESNHEEKYNGFKRELNMLNK